MSFHSNPHGMLSVFNRLYVLDSTHAARDQHELV